MRCRCHIGLVLVLLLLVGGSLGHIQDGSAAPPLRPPMRFVRQAYYGNAEQLRAMVAEGYSPDTVGLNGDAGTTIVDALGRQARSVTCGGVQRSTTALYRARSLP